MTLLHKNRSDPRTNENTLQQQTTNKISPLPTILSQTNKNLNHHISYNTKTKQILQVHQKTLQQHKKTGPDHTKIIYHHTKTQPNPLQTEPKEPETTPQHSNKHKNKQKNQNQKNPLYIPQ